MDFPHVLLFSIGSVFMVVGAVNRMRGHKPSAGFLLAGAVFFVMASLLLSE